MTTLAPLPFPPHRWSLRSSRPPAAVSGAGEEAPGTAGKNLLLRKELARLLQQKLPRRRPPLRRSGSARLWAVRAPPSPREALRASSIRYHILGLRLERVAQGSIQQWNGVFGRKFIGTELVVCSSTKRRYIPEHCCEYLN